MVATTVIRELKSVLLLSQVENQRLISPLYWVLRWTYFFVWNITNWIEISEYDNHLADIDLKLMC